MFIAVMYPTTLEPECGNEVTVSTPPCWGCRIHYPALAIAHMSSHDPVHHITAPFLDAS